MASPTAQAANTPSAMSRKDITDIIAADRKIVSPRGIEELIPVPINGATQWLSIRGRDTRNPVLLFLHGGPGSPTMPVDFTFQSPWEDYFTVVEWDQRGTGKTYASNDPNQLASTITMEQMTSDAEEVIKYLQTHLAKKKIFLMGQSWGSAMGLTLAASHPEWLYAYIGVGQIINSQESEARGYQFALDQAKAHGNQEAISDLQKIAPYPGPIGSLTVDRIGTQRKWLMYYGGLTWGRQDFSWDANAWVLSPDYTDNDLDKVDEGSLYSITHLLGTVQTLNYETLTTFRCPLFFFEGRHDYDVSSALVAAWFKRVHAPQKKFVWFEDSAHMVMEEQPGRFLFHLVTDVRPLAAASGDIAPDEAVE
ncbi:MAG TPA: alpha/beta hydrolase [Terriglobales bacterium]